MRAALVLTILITGCASAERMPARSVASDNKKTDTVVTAKPSGLHVYPLSWVGRSQCPDAKSVERTKGWRDLVAFANRCLSQKKFKELNSIATKIAEIEPELPWGAYYLSIEAESVGQPERALWMVDLAIKKGPGYGVLRYQKGRLLWQKGFLKEAISEMQSALNMDSSIVDAQLVLGEAYLSELEFKTAYGHFQKVLSSNPTHYNGLVGMVNTVIELEKAGEAIAYCQTGIQSYPRDMNFRLREAFVYENLTQQTDVALAKFKDLQRLMARKAVDGQTPFDLDAKIKDLESTVKASGKKLASVGDDK